MKLFLIRHAKSSWEDLTLEDFLRPLNKRGVKDASFMAKLLKEKNIKPDLIICSPSVRTKLTSEFFIKELDFENEIIFEKAIYEAPFEKLKKVLNNIDDKYKTIFLIGHNPGLCDLANSLCKDYFENIPTCGIVEIDFDTNSWKNIQKENSKLICFEYPKKYK